MDQTTQASNPLGCYGLALSGLDGAENAIDVGMRHYQIQGASLGCVRLRELLVIMNGGADAESAD